MTTLVSLARHAAKQWPDREALRIDLTDTALTFAEFDARTDAIAAGLFEAGIRKGDRVAVCSGNGALFPLAWFGIIKAGAIMVPVNISYRMEDARHLLDLAEPKAAFCDAERMAMVRVFAEYVPSLETFITDASQFPEGWHGIEDFGRSEVAMIFNASSDDLTNIQFTSGTSGMPKGCMLDHNYWITLARSVEEAVITLAPGETMLTAQAFSYLDPQWAFVLTLMTGARLVVLERFRPSELWHKIGHYDACFFYCLAAMPLMLLSCPANAAEKEHSLRVVMCSAIPADRHRELEERFAVPWLEAYGATETGSDLGVARGDHARTVGAATIGKPLPHREAKIVDETGKALADGETGEMLVKGPAMMQGYWRNPEATESAFSDSWYRTGDLVRRDTEGFYYLVGRQKDMIRRAGENIAAAEVETVLQQHPAVMIAACIAVPDPIRNEEIKVFVVRSLDVEVCDLVAFLETNLARFKIPRYWAFTDALPMTPSERVAKPKLSNDIGAEVFDRMAEASS